MTNYEKIKQMSVEEMAKMLLYVDLGNTLTPNRKFIYLMWVEWLESEVKNE